MESAPHILVSGECFLPMSYVGGVVRGASLIECFTSKEAHLSLVSGASISPLHKGEHIIMMVSGECPLVIRGNTLLRMIVSGECFPPTSHM